MPNGTENRGVPRLCEPCFFPLITPQIPPSTNNPPRPPPPAPHPRLPFRVAAARNRPRNTPTVFEIHAAAPRSSARYGSATSWHHSLDLPLPGRLVASLPAFQEFLLRLSKTWTSWHPSTSRLKTTLFSDVRPRRMDSRGSVPHPSGRARRTLLRRALRPGTTDPRLRFGLGLTVDWRPAATLDPRLRFGFGLR